ncbi:phage tail protein [Yersinia ruckeri]|uniref:phage tail-collar fiber domain-containing protein n=1 Tax=Yersinia ruckeri TaxID=29486 RepID=UPI0020BE83BE|nr:phage tail protein [Yersinia ruckeri]MCK8583695.1 phage tail protein [Yersinia ruckeri]
MTARFYALLTHVGAAKLANATALGTRLDITQMAVGDGGGTLPAPNPAQTQLIGEQRRAALNRLSIDPINTSQIIAEQVIPENEGGWWIREIGLYDSAGDLVAIANCAETYKPQLQEGSGRTQTIRMILIVSSTEAVTLKIDPSVVLATRKYVDDKVIEVKQYADNVLADHVKTANPHRQYLQSANFLSEISALGADALAKTLTNLKLDDTISKAGKAFSQTKVSDVVGENGVPWNAPSGLYSARYESSSSAVIYTAMIVHFNMGSGSCPAFQLKIHYRNGGVYYRSARDGFGFERDWELVGSDAAPVGIPMPWPTAFPPSGWLKCNGSPFDKSKYPQLALAYPAGYLPDLRGEFIRGWDDGRGADNNRALLSAQLGTAFPSMYVYATSATRGTLVTQPISAFGDKFPIEGKPVDTEGVENTPSSGAYFSTGELSPTGSSSLIKYRVRPRNIAFNYIVRAA